MAQFIERILRSVKKQEEVTHVTLNARCKRTIDNELWKIGLLLHIISQYQFSIAKKEQQQYLFRYCFLLNLLRFLKFFKTFLDAK